MVELVFMASGHKRRGASPIPDQEETNGMESLDNIKVLTRGESAIIAGVCSGIAEYYHLRKNSIRLAFLLTSLFFAIPVFAYVVCG
ncbi:PspC domain-containing protein [Shewanella frigidimarina]|uniref:PspC domain-containing protein n=1 Tax=Shewanella frigidimarina TaxID=56812 RepID=UPI003FA12686